MATSPEPTASDPPLDLPDGGLLGEIVRLNLVVSDELQDIAARSGLTFADYLVLGVVRQSRGARSAPSTIARVLDRTKGGVTLALDRLEAEGLLRRSRHADDGRRVVVELTARGRRVAVAVNDELHAWEAALDLSMPVGRAVEVLAELTAAVTATRRAAIS
jgi:DNA-binding MarR family transcriptional regulator